MDRPKGSGVSDDYSGIELAPNTNHNSQPGLEVVGYSNLEVAAAPPPHLNDDPSKVPQWSENSSYAAGAAASWPYDHHYKQASAPETPLYDPYNNNGTAPSYEYISPNGEFGSGDAPKEGFFRQETICGVKSKLFWIIMAVGILTLVAAVAIGIGLGIALHKNDNPTSTATPSPSANSTSSTGLPLPTATATTGARTSILCPANNLTLYTSNVAGTNRSYLLLCGRDYSSFDGAVDLSNEPLNSMSECIDECARQELCTAAGWGNYQNTQTCWLKTKLGQPNTASGWYFAIEDTNATKTT